MNKLILFKNNKIISSIPSSKTLQYTKRYFIGDSNLSTPFLSKNQQINLKKEGESENLKNGISKENMNIIDQQKKEKPTSTVMNSNNNNNNDNNQRIFDQETFPKSGGIGNNNHHQTGDGLKSFKVVSIDINGNPSEERVYKGSLSSELKLQARDLRTIDPSFPPQMPTILIRDKVILISIGCVRAVVQYNRVMLFDTQNTSIREETITGIRDSLTLQGTEYLPLPFEFKVFESILDLVCRKLEFEFRRMQSLIEKELQLLNENPEHNLEELLLYHKKGLNQFEVKIKEIIDAITDILASDEDMALMYLSFRHATGGARKKNQHDEIEILLETYTRQLEQMSSNISQLKETLNSTEEFVNFQLDTARNKMMRMNLMLSLVTISTGLGGVIAGTFGMNLFTGLEHSPNAFYIACGAITTIGLLTFSGLKYYCQVKNILPYTKKTPAHLQLGLGFRNDSFINPLRDNIILKEQSQQILKEQQQQVVQQSLAQPLQQQTNFKEIRDNIEYNVGNNNNNNGQSHHHNHKKIQKLNKVQQFQQAQQIFQQQHSNQYIVELQQQIQQQHYQIEKLQELQYQLITQQQKIQQSQQKQQLLNLNNATNSQNDTTNNEDASIIDDDLTVSTLNDDLGSSAIVKRSILTKRYQYTSPTPNLNSFWKILQEESQIDSSHSIKNSSPSTAINTPETSKN